MASAISRFMLDLRMFVESNPRLGNFPDLQLNIGKALFDVQPHTFSK